MSRMHENLAALRSIRLPGSWVELRGLLWRRHRNPCSGWTRVAIGPLLALAIWLHSWPLIGFLALAALTNPFWFPPPDRDDDFMTRAVDGERLWLERAERVEKFLVMGVPALMVVPLVWVLWTHQALWAAFFVAVLLAHKLVFVVWAAQIADAVPADERRPA